MRKNKINYYFQVWYRLRQKDKNKIKKWPIDIPYELLVYFYIGKPNSSKMVILLK